MYFWGKGLAAKALAAWQKKGRKAATYAEVTAESKEVAVAEKTAEVAPETTALDATIAWTQLLLCVSLQTLENGAYLSSKGVLGWSPATQGKAFKWSARFWAAYTGIELGRLAVEGLSTSKAAKARTAEETADWRRKFARNLAWAPLTVHWSSEKGLVGDLTVGLLGSIPGIIQIRELWASTAGEA
ncbi:hypothetical protein B0T17DRAFT_533208 [Bombardia bombarda]|uniref:Uncharacterized protein n=1 Tax=Bombardia bombarda TaxID=252184 RepID=A0AA40C159_9PEZI|nr:hypothetical protein B0T17DRAFT_533208 [Bombardia bombarda]